MGVRSASTTSSAGSVARFTRRAGWNIGYTFNGLVMVTVFWKPMTVCFSVVCLPTKTYPGLGNACNTTVEFAARYTSAVELYGVPPTETAPGLWQFEGSGQLKNTTPRQIG